LTKLKYPDPGMATFEEATKFISETIGKK